MAFDTHSNLASATILLAPTPVLSGETFVVGTSEGDLFAANMPCTIYPNGVQPSRANAEIGYITGVSGDELTITRGQEGTTAKPVDAGWKILAGPTVKTFTDIEEAISTADKHFEYPFLTSSVVTVNHNLGKRPSVTVVDSAGDEVVGSVNHISNNQLIVTFSGGFSGIVFCN